MAAGELRLGDRQVNLAASGNSPRRAPPCYAAPMLRRAWPIAALAASLAPACAGGPTDLEASPTPAPAPLAAAPPAPTPAPARVYPRTRFVWVRYAPRASNAWLGYLWFGGSATLRDPTPIPAPGCAGAYYAVEPRGYVCVDGEAATLDPNDPVVVALRDLAPRLDSPWPHEYGDSLDLRRSPSVPGHDGEPLPLLPELPRTLRESRTRIWNGSPVAWTREFDADGRSWLLSADLAVMPKDRVAPYPRSTFHGLALEGDTKLPLAFFRAKARPKWRFDDDTPVATGASWERLDSVGLTGASRVAGGRTFLETRESGVFVAADDATVPTPRAATPWGAPIGDDEPAPPGPGRHTWLEISVLGGWLIAYEGSRPVYTTLISPGRGGIPFPGIDPLKTASTPLGVFRIDGKFATATMVTDETLLHSDVPWTQNFHGPHALHAAYWHDAWGERKSGGCVNVSPTDGKWLYEFTEPAVPEGWHGYRSDAEAGPATTVVVHR